MGAKKLVGSSYKLDNGIRFKVIDTELYPAREVSHKFKTILDFKAEHLVAISYRGTLIPNITLENGVVRLTKVEVDGKVFDRPGAISRALGIEEYLTAYDIKEVG
jgi:hypothetical protein